MDTLKTIFERRSIRTFLDKEIEQEKLNNIKKAFALAPNWINGQQRSMILIKDKLVKQKLYELSGKQPSMLEAPVIAIILIDMWRINKALEITNTKGDFEIGTNQIMISAFDAGIASQNVALAAKAQGLETVMVGALRGNLYNSQESGLKILQKLLNLPSQYVYPIIAIPIGYSKKIDGNDKRLPNDGVIFNEKYNAIKAEEAIKEFDQTYNYRGSNWTRAISWFYKNSPYKFTTKDLEEIGFKIKDQD